jgi:coenzyme F420-reducing hydrogenase beta subunit
MNHNKLEHIIDGGYCIGCGACKIVDPSIQIELDGSGKLQAQIQKQSEETLYEALRVCPFSDEGANEDAIGKRLFGDTCEHDRSTGYYKQLFVGHIQEDTFREEGASGGVISWVLAELLRCGKIDA